MVLRVYSHSQLWNDSMRLVDCIALERACVGTLFAQRNKIWTLLANDTYQEAQLTRELPLTTKPCLKIGNREILFVG